MAKGGSNKSLGGGGNSKASGGPYGKNSADATKLGLPPRLGKSSEGWPAPTEGAPNKSPTWPGDNPKAGGIEAPKMGVDNMPAPSGYRGPGSKEDHG